MGDKVVDGCKALKTMSAKELKAQTQNALEAACKKVSDAAEEAAIAKIEQTADKIIGAYQKVKSMPGKAKKVAGETAETISEGAKNAWAKTKNKLTGKKEEDLATLKEMLQKERESKGNLAQLIKEDAAKLNCGEACDNLEEVAETTVDDATDWAATSEELKGYLKKGKSLTNKIIAEAEKAEKKDVPVPLNPSTASYNDVDGHADVVRESAGKGIKAMMETLDERVFNDDDDANPIDQVRMAAEYAAMIDPSGVASIIAAYTYPKCEEYFGA